MAIKSNRIAAALIAACLLLLTANASIHAADGPNRLTSSDVKAGQWMDSFMASKLPQAQQQRYRQASRPTRNSERPGTAQRRPSLQGKLIKNTSLRADSPAYALVNRQGQILRYIEPVRSIDLRQYLGQSVTVRRDTGKVLLASQLVLPKTNPRPIALKSRRSIASNNNLRRLAHEETIAVGEPTPANELAEELVDTAMDAAAENIDSAAEELALEPIEAAAETESNIVGNGYEEEYYQGNESFVDDGYQGGYDDGIDFGGCTDCGSYVCKQFGGCGRGSRGRAYVRGEYVLWWFDGMDTPALVTQSTDPADGGVLGRDTTTILFGGEDLLTDPRSGGRLLMGIWIDDAGKQAIEFDYLRFNTEELTYSIYGEDGNPTISRPFFDIFPETPPARRAAEQVSSDILDGRVTVNIRSDFETFGIRFRHNLCCCTSCNTDCGDGCGGGVGCGSGVSYGGGCSGGTRRIDLLTGFRYGRLDESLHIREDLTVDTDDATNPDPNLPPHGTQFLVQDWFETENEFTGAELGFLWEIEHQRWSLELLSKLAVGNNRQRVRINGSTLVTVPGATTVPPAGVGGLLAQSTNIGTYERDQFSIMPEIGVTLGCRVTPRFKFTAGYSLLYWSNVVRPGDQIDLDINSSLIPRADNTGTPIPPADPIVGAARPAFEFQNTNIWAHGLNVGGEYRW